MLFPVPTSPPENITLVSTTPFSLVLIWSPPITPNGVITGYLIIVIFTNGSTPLELAGGAAIGDGYTITGLGPYESVTVSVAARTALGVGPSTTLTVTTLQYSELYQ